MIDYSMSPLYHFLEGFSGVSIVKKGGEKMRGEIRKEIFWEAVERVVAQGRFNPKLPRATFTKCLIELRKGPAGALFLKNSLVSAINDWEDLFLQIVAEMGLLPLAPNSLGTRKPWAAPAACNDRGAWNAEYRHRRTLGDDY